MKLPQFRLIKTKWLIIAAGVVFLGLAIFQISSISSKRREVTAAEKSLAAAGQKSKKLSEILSQARTVEGNLEVLQHALPADDKVPALVIQLEQIAKQSGMRVEHLGFAEGKVETRRRGVSTEEGEEGEEGSAPSSGSKLKTISLTTVVDGSYASLQTFLRNLENASRVVNVTNFRFSETQKKEEDSQGSPLSATLGMEAFYLVGGESVLTDAPLTLDTASKEYIDLVRRVKALRIYRSEIEE